MNDKNLTDFDLTPDLFSAANLIDEKVSGGFCLDKFQVLNWGVFDKNIYTLDAQNKSTLLTGQNGSGKTTLVDALVTLLVPNQMRFYNQSSGSTKKKDRSEESYVLGAYGSRQSDDGSSGKTQYLREKDTISILNGVFYNQQLDSYVSLLQVRYFASDVLVRIFAVTRQNLTIENIYDFLEKENLTIDRAGKWKKLLTNSFGTVFFGDNFKKYSETFSQIFGFRSEKALKLFSQIVGLKVLGNLTDFIRQNMLEQTGTEEEFQKLQENYTKLLQCDNEIQKTKMQLELLEKVVSTGHKLKETEIKKQENEIFSETLPAWKSKNALELLEKENQKIEGELEEENQKLFSSKSEKEKLENEINILQADLASNDIARQIQNLDSEISAKIEEKSRAQNRFENYSGKITKIGLEIPATEIQFNKNKEKLSAVQDDLTAQKENFEQKRFNLQTKINDDAEKISKIKEELASLGERNSNIPLENILIRKKICDALKIPEENLPFAGELIQVKKGEEDWTFAIERLLHNFALTVLVRPELYKTVTDYVRKNDLGGRLVYLKTEEEIFGKKGDFFARDNRAALGDKMNALQGQFSQGEISQGKNPEYLPQKIEIKNRHPLATWLCDYIANHFDYICSDDTETIAQSEKALSSTGLIKNGLRHEKDDRRKIRENFTQVLGWDNTQKRQALSGQLDSLEKGRQENASQLEKIKISLAENQEKTEALHSVKEFLLWSELDVKTLAKQIDLLNDERKKLASSKEIKELMQKLDAKKEAKSALDSQIEKLNRTLGRLQDNLEKIRSQKNQNEKIWQTYTAQAELFELTQKNIELLEKRFSLNLKLNLKPEQKNAQKITNLEELEEIHKNLFATINENLKRAEKDFATLNETLTRQMLNVINPKKEIKEKFGDWSSQFSDFDASFSYFDDFETFYNRLLKDDLPKYQTQFHKYLHDTINEDIIDFNQHIENCCQQIRTAIENLNKSLKLIVYQHSPDTFLQLIINPSADQRIREFRNKLKNAIPDHIQLQMNGTEYEEKLFGQIKNFLNSMQANQNFRDFVLDVRNWFNFAASENYTEDGSQKQFYSDSASLSGGEKAKLTYTILASAIAYQFGLDKNSASSFRFVIIDEAFSKSDAANSEYAMKLFKQLGLQLMTVTPLDKINIVEDYISSIHMTENKNTNDSRLISMSIEKYRLGGE